MEELRPGGNCQALVYVAPSKAPGSAPWAEQSSLQSRGAGNGGSVQTSPVLLCQQQLLKVQVQLLAWGSPDRPHAVHAARLVARIAGREDAADGGIVDCPAAGS